MLKKKMYVKKNEKKIKHQKKLKITKITTMFIIFCLCLTCFFLII